MDVDAPDGFTTDASLYLSGRDYDPEYTSDEEEDDSEEENSEEEDGEDPFKEQKPKAKTPRSQSLFGCAVCTENDLRVRKGGLFRSWTQVLNVLNRAYCRC